MKRRLAAAALVLTVGLTAGCAVPVDVGNHGRSPGSHPSYPTHGQPTLIAINHNHFEARHVGHTTDGGQFFLTRPYSPTQLFVALYLFDADGRFLSAKIDKVADDQAARKIYRERLHELGKVKSGRIEVAPFSVQRFGLTFGLVAAAPTAGITSWTVTAEPGDYMAFSPPWNLGDYAT